MKLDPQPFENICSQTDRPTSVTCCQQWQM